jgi:hypothetical protein
MSSNPHQNGHAADINRSKCLVFVYFSELAKNFLGSLVELYVKKFMSLGWFFLGRATEKNVTANLMAKTLSFIFA